MGVIVICNIKNTTQILQSEDICLDKLYWSQHLSFVSFLGTSSKMLTEFPFGVSPGLHFHFWSLADFLPDPSFPWPLFCLETDKPYAVTVKARGWNEEWSGGWGGRSKGNRLHSWYLEIVMEWKQLIGLVLVLSAFNLQKKVWVQLSDLMPIFITT